MTKYLISYHGCDHGSWQSICAKAKNKHECLMDNSWIIHGLLVDDSWVIHGLLVGQLGMVYGMGLSALLMKGSLYISFRMVNLYHQDIVAGWWLTNPSEKYESRLGWLFPYKNVPNHQSELEILRLPSHWQTHLPWMVVPLSCKFVYKRLPN